MRGARRRGELGRDPEPSPWGALRDRSRAPRAETLARAQRRPEGWGKGEQPPHGPLTRGEPGGATRGRASRGAARPERGGPGTWESRDGAGRGPCPFHGRPPPWLRVLGSVASRRKPPRCRTFSPGTAGFPLPAGLGGSRAAHAVGDGEGNSALSQLSSPAFPTGHQPVPGCPEQPVATVNFPSPAGKLPSWLPPPPVAAGLWTHAECAAGGESHG